MRQNSPKQITVGNGIGLSRLKVSHLCEHCLASVPTCGGLPYIFLTLIAGSRPSYPRDFQGQTRHSQDHDPSSSKGIRDFSRMRFFSAISRSTGSTRGASLRGTAIDTARTRYPAPTSRRTTSAQRHPSTRPRHESETVQHDSPFRVRLAPPVSERRRITGGRSPRKRSVSPTSAGVNPRRVVATAIGSITTICGPCFNLL